MPQLVLDPGDQTTVGFWKPQGPIPPVLRRVGRFPNTDDWLPGDLVLMSKIQPDLNQRAIIGAQERGGFEPLDARWQHAAVYLGENGLCEAAGSGVRVSSLITEYVGSHLLRVRRPDLDVHERYRLCMKSLTRTPEPYDWLGAFVLLLQSVSGFWRQGPRSVLPPHSGPVICSELYAWSYLQVASRLLVKPDPGRPLTPADLSMSTELEYVPVCWRQIV